MVSKIVIKQISFVNFEKTLTMAKFKIDDTEYDTDKLDNKQKRVIALYQKAVQEEAEAIASLEVKRAGRIEIGRKLKELVLEEPPKKKN